MRMQLHVVFEMGDQKTELSALVHVHNFQKCAIRIDCGSAKLEIKGFLLLVVVVECFFLEPLTKKRIQFQEGLQTMMAKVAVPYSQQTQEQERKREAREAAQKSFLTSPDFVEGYRVCIRDTTTQDALELDVFDNVMDPQVRFRYCWRDFLFLPYML